MSKLSDTQEIAKENTIRKKLTFSESEEEWEKIENDCRKRKVMVIDGEFCEFLIEAWLQENAFNIIKQVMQPTPNKKRKLYEKK